MGDQALICASCGAALKAGAKFCSKCGAKVIEKRYCGNCGAELDADDRFCGLCGTPVDVVGGAEATGKTTSKTAGKAVLKTVNDSGYYHGHRPKEIIHVNTPDYYFFVPPNTDEKGISRIDQNMKGKSTRVHNDGTILAMSIVDGALAVLARRWNEDEDAKFYLEYFTLDLEYIRDEQVNGLYHISATKGYTRFLMSGSFVFEIVSTLNGRESYQGVEYIDCNMTSYNILSGHCETRPLAATGGEIILVGGAWLHQSDLYIELLLDQKDKWRMNYLVRTRAEQSGVEAIAKAKSDQDGGWPLFFDFDKDIMWTYLTDAECGQFGLTVGRMGEAYLGARRIKQGAPLLAEYPFWKIPNKHTYSIAYFDGEFMFETPYYHILSVCTQSGDRIDWPNTTGHGKAVQMFVWNGKIIGDLNGCKKCCYHPKQLQYTEGIEIEGIEGF